MSSCFGQEYKNNKKKNRHSSNDNNTTTAQLPLQRSYSEESLKFLKEAASYDKTLLTHPSSALLARQVVVRNILMLYNPSSGSHKGERIMIMAKSELEQKGIVVQAIPLQHKNHAMEICKTHDFTACDVLCVIGGDGTFHECVNGLMSRQSAPQSQMGSSSILSPARPKALPVLAIIPAGTGNSLVLELAGASNIKYSIARILQGLTIPIDILKITVLYTHNEVNAQGEQACSPSTTPRSDASVQQLIEFSNEPQVESEVNAGRLEKKVIYAFNSIHWGLGSKVSETAERLRWMRHALRYTSAALVEIMRGSSTRAKIVMEDEHGNIEEADDNYSLLIANNIGTAAKGMKMAPAAKINDGLVDLLLFKSHRVPDLLRVFKKVYKGTHTQLPYVYYKQVRKFAVIPYKPSGKLVTEGNPEVTEELVDIDGELVGCTPFMCETINNPLDIIV